MPIAMAPFSIEECACSDVYTTKSDAVPLARAFGSAASRAAARACMLPTDAVSNIWPNQSSGRPVHWRSQRSVTCSSSTIAGHDFHNMPLPLSADASNSPRIPGAEPEFAKKAMKPGGFQWVTRSEEHTSELQSLRDL